MIVLCLLACLALASAAPQFGFGEEHRPFRPPPHHHHHHHHHPGSAEDFFGGEIFDTRRFWADMEARMHQFDQMMTEFTAHFPVRSSQAGVQDNEYVVVINLNGFEEKDIKVKAREGVLMVQAVHKTDDGSESSYIDLKTLPANVNVNGTWIYNMGVLKITFPLKSVEPATETAVAAEETEQPTTESRDREEMDETQGQNENHDADVGLGRGDRDEDAEILTNVIPNAGSVEATTYAVDLDNEVEFVPIKY